MGSGKTTVSRCLERKYGFRRLEMDALIEEKAHMSISEIFRTQGEQGFRRMETDLLLKIAKASQGDRRGDLPSDYTGRSDCKARQ